MAVPRARPRRVALAGALQAPILIQGAVARLGPTVVLESAAYAEADELIEDLSTGVPPSLRRGAPGFGFCAGCEHYLPGEGAAGACRAHRARVHEAEVCDSYATRARAPMRTDPSAGLSGELAAATPLHSLREEGLALDRELDPDTVADRIVSDLLG